jgi:hypothetical protein
MWSFDRDDVAGGAIHQCRAERGLVRDAALARIGFGRAEDFVDFFFALCPHDNDRAESDCSSRASSGLNRNRTLKLVFESVNFALRIAECALGLLVFRVVRVRGALFLSARIARASL